MGEFVYGTCNRRRSKNPDFFDVVRNTLPLPGVRLRHTQKKTCIPESRACLKNAFCKMCVTICGRFRPDEGAVAGYGNRIRVKSPAKWDVQIAGMIFQTRSKLTYTRQYFYSALLNTSLSTAPFWQATMVVQTASPVILTAVLAISRIRSIPMIIPIASTGSPTELKYHSQSNKSNTWNTCGTKWKPVWQFRLL